MLKEIDHENGTQQAVLKRFLRIRRRAYCSRKSRLPPMNLLGPELVRDLVSLIQQTEADDSIHVLVFKSPTRTISSPMSM